jgi:hypothetical protein
MKNFLTICICLLAVSVITKAQWKQVIESYNPLVYFDCGGSVYKICEETEHQILFIVPEIAAIYDVEGLEKLLDFDGNTSIWDYIYIENESNNGYEFVYFQLYDSTSKNTSFRKYNYFDKTDTEIYLFENSFIREMDSHDSNLIGCGKKFVSGKEVGIILYSSDNGETWEEIFTADSEYPEITEIFDVKFTGDNEILACAANGNIIEIGVGSSPVVSKITEGADFQGLYINYGFGEWNKPNIQNAWLWSPDGKLFASNTGLRKWHDVTPDGIHHGIADIFQGHDGFYLCWNNEAGGIVYSWNNAYKDSVSPEIEWEVFYSNPDEEFTSFEGSNVILLSQFKGRNADSFIGCKSGHIYENIQTAVEPLDFEQANISISPNPAQQNLRVLSTEILGKLSIYDFSGRELISGIGIIPGNEIEIDISGLSPGSYYCRINSSDKIYSGRFIKSE